MPKQLIYTSAPRGIVPGQSGYCTVARSDEMREALILRMEQLSYYQHLSLSGGTERPISAYRIVEIRGTRYHVLSKIQDAGLDFTGRTNFIAHHLVFEPKEIGGFPSPPVILRDWPDWKTSWTQEPELLKNEDSVWNKIKNLAVKSNGEAKTWRVVTGNAENGYGLLDALRGTSFRVDDQTDIFGLFAESLELLEVRRKGFPNAAWDFTFTTSMQEQDNPADFLWRCIHSDNPAANRFITPDCCKLSAVRATKWTDEETTFARTGRQAPRFTTEPQDVQTIEGENVCFIVKAEGVPTPNYQWFRVERDNNEKILPGKTKPELVIENPDPGKTRYKCMAINGRNAQSRVATLSVEQKLRIPKTRVESAAPATLKPLLYNVKSGEDIKRNQRRLADVKALERTQRRRRNTFLVTIIAAVLIAGAIVAALILKGRKTPYITSQLAIQTNQDGSMSINFAASGTKPLTYQWYKNNQPFSSTTNSCLPLEKNALNIPTSFSVTVSNSIGSVSSIVVQWTGSLASDVSPKPVSAQAPVTSPSHSINNGAVSRNPGPQVDFEELTTPWKHYGDGTAKMKYVATAEIFDLTGTNLFACLNRTELEKHAGTNSVQFAVRLSGQSNGKGSLIGIAIYGEQYGATRHAFIGLRDLKHIVGNNAYVTPAPPGPIFFGITCNTNGFICAYSINGTNWTNIETNEPPSLSDENYLVGLLIKSTGLNVHAEFDNMNFNPVSE